MIDFLKFNPNRFEFKTVALVCLLLLISSCSFSRTLLIYGGENHDVFLGCLNCDRFDRNSVWNKFGPHGSKFKSECIWNKFGDYGGKFSDYSPFNIFASNPPILVDESGNFYGYFTANKFHAKRTTNRLALFIVEHWEDIIEDVSEAYDCIFR